MKNGQTLVVLLIFMAAAVTISTAAAVMMVNNSRLASDYEQTTMAYDVAESGAENALLRLLRDPGYTGETLTIDQGTATITVTGNNPTTIVSVGSWGNFTRRIEVSAGYANSILTVTSWQETAN